MVVGFLAFAAALDTRLATIETTLCAIVERPQAFTGRVVRFRAGVLTDWHHGTVLVHSGCKRGIALTSTDGVLSDQTKALNEAVGTPLDGGPDRTAMATFTGHFSVRSGERQDAFDNPLRLDARLIQQIKAYPKARAR